MARTSRTKILPNGTRVIRRPANDNVPEWRIQAEAVRRLRGLPGYGDEAGEDVAFTLAGDFNAARRSRQEIVKAKATGLTAGEEDLRIYGRGGRLLLIEVKGARTPVSADQKLRHALHRHLGFEVVVVRGKTESDGAERVVSIVNKWLARAS